MPWGRGRARPADSQPAGPRTPPHTPRGRPLPDRCPSQFVGVSGCGCDDRFCVCGCHGYTAAVAPHATGSTPPGPVPLPVCRRQWLRRRRQVLRLRLPRLYSGGGAETAWPPSGFLFSARSLAARMWLKPGWFRAPAPSQRWRSQLSPALPQIERFLSAFFSRSSGATPLEVGHQQVGRRWRRATLPVIATCRWVLPLPRVPNRGLFSPSRLPHLQPSPHPKDPCRASPPPLLAAAMLSMALPICPRPGSALPWGAGWRHIPPGARTPATRRWRLRRPPPPIVGGGRWYPRWSRPASLRQWPHKRHVLSRQSPRLWRAQLPPSPPPRASVMPPLPLASSYAARPLSPPLPRLGGTRRRRRRQQHAAAAVGTSGEWRRL